MIRDEQQSPAPKIEFLRYHHSPLEVGAYDLEIKQTISGVGDAVYSQKARFYVAGERFQIIPAAIHSVFPPPQSRGDHSAVLPHLILQRSTLPWERTIGNDAPWLILLVFHEGEEAFFQDIPASDTQAISAGFNKMEGRNVTLGELRNPSTGETNWPGFAPEPGDKDDEVVRVIDVKKELLQEILPGNVETLHWLSHVRQGLTLSGVPVGDDKAVLIANRLPRSGGNSVVHLVSLEGHVNDGKFNYGAGDNPFIRLVSLKSWQFYCTPAKGIKPFASLLKSLDSGSFHLPLSGKPNADKYLAAGFLPLPQQFRGGQRSTSWYHGPFVSGQKQTENLTLPARSADALLRYDKIHGMFDVSYAAAWELGRLLTLNNKTASIRLFQWKREHYQSLSAMEEVLRHPHILAFHQNADTRELPDLPAVVSDWLNDLSQLKHIPFNYLVPDERVVPVESIRFFMVDPDWLSCLLDGAFSIGRVARHNHVHDTSLVENHLPDNTGQITGFMLRSEMAAGWPDMVIEGYGATPDAQGVVGDKLELIRKAYLSDNVLLCLFKGNLKTLDIHLPPERLHFGLQRKAGGTGFQKALRNSSGVMTNKSVDLENENIINNASLVLDIPKLTSAIDAAKSDLGFNQFFSAEFALAMLEGVPKVRFTGIGG